MPNSQIIGLVCFLIWFTGCGNTNFGSGGKSPKSGAGESDAEKNNGPVLIKGDNLSSDDDAINKCLTKFGDHPFDEQGVRNYRKIAAAVTVLGGGSGIVDEEVTSKPKLILVTATVNVLGSTKYRLLNPNGFYCFKVGVNVLANTDVDLHCDAQLADSKVNVQVGSQGGTGSQVGVHVLSNLKVSKVCN